MTAIEKSLNIFEHNNKLTIDNISDKIRNMENKYRDFRL